MADFDQEHTRKVIRIRTQVKAFFKHNKKFRIYHGTTNSTRKQSFDKDAMVDISDLNQVLSVNKRALYAIVEPNVPMDQLVTATLKHGLIPPVVMEFPGITVGGGIQGCAGESSSFKYGSFHHTCSEYEIVLANGDIVKANEKTNTDLFWGTACSYGSLGIITKIKLHLIPAKKYVKLTYHKVSGFKESVAFIEKATRESYDFIDGILYNTTKGVIMTGIFSDDEDLPKQTFSRATDDWFYTHAESIIKKHQTYTELIPLVDYLFRYNRGGFWVGKYPYTRAGIPFNRFTRFLFNKFNDTRTLYRFLHAINISQRWMVQDVCLPKDNIVPFLEYCNKALDIYPIWLCPGKFGDKYDKLSPGFLKAKRVIDVGVWGKLSGDYSKILELNRDFEKKLIQHQGRKVLYAHQYYTEDEFWKIYDKNWYMKLRKKYNADKVFPDIYEKTKVKERYEFSVKKGLWDIIKSPFKLPIN